MTLYELLPTGNRRNRLATRRHVGADPFLGLQRRAGRFFEDFFRDFALEPSTGLSEFSRRFAPSVDMTETDSELVISAELPGVDENDVEVSLSEGRLTIKGEKKHETETREDNCYRMERSYGAFERVLDLPCEVDEDNSAAEFRKGILTITLAKVPEKEEKSRKIEIKSN